MKLRSFHASNAVAAFLLAAAFAGAQPSVVSWRGTNWVPGTSGSLNNVVAMLPAANPTGLSGSYDGSRVRAELDRMAASGVNNIRLIPAFWAWVIDRAAYMNILRDVAEACGQRGISITYQIWSGIGATASVVSADGVQSPELWHELIGSSATDPTNPAVLGGCLLRSATSLSEITSAGVSLPPGHAWIANLFTEPGNELIAMSGDDRNWPYDMKARIDAYLTDIATFFSQERIGQKVFASYDLFNEPDAYVLPGPSFGNHATFIRLTWQRLVAVHPTARFTVGWARDDGSAEIFDAQVRSTGTGLDYFSYHSYANAETFVQRLDLRKIYADNLGVPLVMSEFHRTDFTAGVLGHQLAALDARGVGGQVWGFIQSCTFVTSPSGSWPLDGIYVGVPTGSTSNPLAFVPNNPVDHFAFEAWAAGTLIQPPFTAAAVLDASGPVTALTAGQTFDLQVTSSRVNEPVLAILTPVPAGAPACQGSFPNCSIIPGLGPIALAANSEILVLGTTSPTGISVFPSAISVAPILAGGTIYLTVYAGVFPSGDFNQNVGEVTAPWPYPVQ